MTSREPILFKKIWLWLAFVACAVLAVYIAFVSLISVWVGIDHAREDGFWVPILIGVLILVGIGSVFFRLSRNIFSHMKDDQLIRM